MIAFGVMTRAGALHTHDGWHKRRENIDNGTYEKLNHP